MIAEKMKLKAFFIITAALFNIIQISNAASPKSDNINQFLQSKVVRQDTNVHYAGKYCEECHIQVPEKGVDTILKFGGDFKQLCRCHNYNAGNYIHPVYVKPSEEKKSRIPREFPLENGELTCSTCHDVYIQCQQSKSLPVNINFLRGAPYSNREEICFRCHDITRYKKNNPHKKQLNGNGEIIAEKCLYCHVEKPDEMTAIFEEVKYLGNLTLHCQRCHNIREKHPSGTDHFLKPPEKILKTMNKLEVRFGMIFPLDKDGKITCVTCHNPHDRGVIPADRRGSMGAGEKFKHRIPQLMCQACHGQ
jgi:hypothetical protein